MTSTGMTSATMARMAWQAWCAAAAFGLCFGSAIGCLMTGARTEALVWFAYGVVGFAVLRHFELVTRYRVDLYFAERYPASREGS